MQRGRMKWLVITVLSMLIAETTASRTFGVFSPWSTAVKSLVPVAEAAEVPSQAVQQSVHYNVVTNEISAKQTDGTKREVYRFDPAVYVATQGEEVTLTFHGLKGHDHPIVLEGYGLKATIHRNEVTTLRFRADKPGFFRLICTAHPDVAHEGPMEAYLVVVPKKG